MPQAFYILFGAAFTFASAVAAGRLLLRSLGLRFFRAEEVVFAFVTGSACLSTLVFLLTAAGVARKGVFLALGAVLIAAAVRRGAHRPEGERFPPLPWFWRVLFGLLFTAFTVLYFFNAMAPEMSADGSAYHLGLVAWYLREHGFPRIATNMYANLSQGIELLYLYAFAFGRHSAAALVHFSFLATLPLAMLSYARRLGYPSAGAAGTLLFYLSPVVGIDGTTAYIDVAVAGILFVLFCLLQIWAKERNNAFLIPIGILAGFSYASKYTAFVAVPYALGFVAWKLVRDRKPWLKPLLVISACAAVMILPWFAKNWIWLDNPFSPFFNRWFPNPYVHVSFEEDYARHMRNYPGLKSHWEIPLEVTVRGAVLCGLLGPVFLLAPLALFSLRERAGRQLLLASFVFGITYAANIGTRFLIFPVPFLALAMGLVFARAKAVAPLVVVFHAIFSWPSNIKIYSDPYAWRLEKVPLKQALRIEPEESYLNFKFPGYAIARMIETMVPKGEKVFAMGQVAQSYTSREVLVAYQAASNHTLGDILWTPMIPDYHPTWHLTFRFPEERLRKVRVVQTEEGKPDQWSVGELRVFHQDAELPRAPRWRLRARPNPWDVQLAFDNSPVTRWRSWQTLYPGMFLEIDFGRPESADAVRVECSHDQYKIRLRLEGQLESGEWKTLDPEPDMAETPPPLGLRQMAMEELKTRGVNYMLIYDGDFGADDLRVRSAVWGITPLGERKGATLYRLD